MLSCCLSILWSHRGVLVKLFRIGRPKSPNDLLFRDQQTVFEV